MATQFEWLQLALFFALLITLAWLLGKYMTRVFSENRHPMLPVLGWLEKITYQLTGVNPEVEQNWKGYTLNLIIFNAFGFLLVFLILVFQSLLPVNPASFPDVSWHLAFNTAASFMSNTNWQSYAGETTLGYFAQMIALTVQNFVSAATGIAVLLALIRGITRKKTDKLGNFWVDITRTIVYVLLPLSIVLSIMLVGQGAIQNFKKYETIQTLQGSQQTIPMGPAASQIAIKQLGTNGGGFFNSNSSHPFENPTPFSNFIEMLAILLIPVALIFTYGKMVGSARHGWIIFAAMLILFVTGLGISIASEHMGNPAFGDLDLMEGKETRIGITASILWSTATTAASNGSVNAMHDSLTPVSGMIALINILLGEVIFGGVGAGLYGIFVFIILTVFIAGLMVGRTPEYLGKKVEAFEVQMAIISIIATSFAILVFSAWAVVRDTALACLSNNGPHGLTEILYAYSSAAGNNGSAFAGLNANNAFFNITLGIGMLIGRFGVIVPVLAIAGRMAGKKAVAYSSGTFRTDNTLFIVLLIIVILIIGGLTFFPALSIGPIAEQLLFQNGINF
jgi:K+-transporting ATPase ATPase A chain